MLPGLQKVSSIYLLPLLSSSRVNLTKYLEILLPVTLSPFFRSGRQAKYELDDFKTVVWWSTKPPNYPELLSRTMIRVIPG
jgi:hypothetical protein